MIDLARQNGLDIRIFHGSVADMPLDKDYFEIMEGVKMFFYDADSIQHDFEKYGLVEFSEIDEPSKDMKNKPPINFIIVKCKKES